MNPIIALASLLGGGYLLYKGMNKNKPGTFTEGKLLGRPRPGETWSLAFRTNRELDDDDYDKLMKAFAMLGSVHGVTKSGDRYLVTIKWAAPNSELKQNRLVWDDGTSIELMGAVRAPIS